MLSRNSRKAVALTTARRGDVAPVLQRAEAAWAEARYDDLIALADGSDVRVSIFAAHALLRRRRPVDALAILPQRRVTDPFVRSRVALLAELATHQRDQAAGTSAPSTFVFSEYDSIAEAETAGLANVFSANSAWIAGDLDEAERFADTVTPAAGPWIEALSSEMRGWIDVRRNDFARAARRFIEALDLLEHAPRGDAHLHLNAVFGLAVIAVETVDLSHLPRLRAECERLPHARELSRWTCLAFVTIALAADLAGEEAFAVSLFMRAQTMETEPAAAAWAIIELCAFHRRAGESRSARVHMERARELLATIDWTRADIETRVLLLRWAVEISDLDYAEAARALTQALSYTGERNLQLAFEHDDRAQTFSTFAHGVLAWRGGDRETARAELERAAAAWTRIGYRHRAAVAELSLSAISPGTFETPTLDAVRLAAPKSWIARYQFAARVPVESADRARSIMPRLGPAERRVLEQICEGRTSKQIAIELGRSPSTIRNQTIRIFRAFEVNDRRALIAKVAAMERR